MKQKRRSQKTQQLAYVIILAALAAVAYATLAAHAPQAAQRTAEPPDSLGITGALGSDHIHADFALYINGERFAFDGRHDVSNALPRGAYAHLHIANPDGGSVLHIHAARVPIALFFEGVGMQLARECLRASSEELYCNSGSATLKLFAQNSGSEWRQIINIEEYVPLDADRILISYGNESTEQLREQFASVTGFSRDYSGPEAVGAGTLK